MLNLFNASKQIELATCLWEMDLLRSHTLGLPVPDGVNMGPLLPSGSQAALHLVGSTSNRTSNCNPWVMGMGLLFLLLVLWGCYSVWSRFHC